MKIDMQSCSTCLSRPRYKFFVKVVAQLFSNFLFKYIKKCYFCSDPRPWLPFSLLMPSELEQKLLTFLPVKDERERARGRVGGEKERVKRGGGEGI